MIDESRPATSLIDDAHERARTVHTGLDTSPPILGRLAGIDGEGCVCFDDGAAVYPVLIGVTDDDETLVRAARAKQTAVVLETARGAVLVALVRERISRDALARAGAATDREETLTLSAETRLELTCGKARIVLERDGRVHVQGTHLLSSATGPIRIKGATVALN